MRVAQKARGGFKNIRFLCGEDGGPLVVLLPVSKYSCPQRQLKQVQIVAQHLGKQVLNQSKETVIGEPIHAELERYRK